MSNERQAVNSYNTYLLKKQELLMAAEDLPKEFDVVVVGTGLEESIVAAAAARNGHTVLHLDPEDYYGGDWAAFTFDGLQDWIKKQVDDNAGKEDDDDEVVKDLLKEGEEFVSLDSRPKSISDIRQAWFVPERNAEPSQESPEDSLESEPKQPESKEEESESEPNQESEPKQAESKEENPESGLNRPESQEPESNEGKSNSEPEEEAESKEDHHDNQIEVKASGDAKIYKWTQEAIMENSRRFNLDLTPRLLYTRGSMVELLISSNISRYTEFKAVSRVLTLALNGKLEHVPSSRADVFATKQVSVVEKRILMKYLTFAVAYETHPEIVEPFKNRPYIDFLKHEKLTDNLIHYVLNSIALVDGTKVTTIEGLEATKKFLKSLGRFGSNTTPFLWTMYGSGEMPQAFCRLCAVFGGTYYLGRKVNGFIISENKVIGVVLNNLRIDCKFLVANGLAVDDKFKKVSKNVYISRKIILSSDSVMPCEKEQLSLVSLPGKTGFTFIEEIGHSAAACPKGLYVLQMSAELEEDLQEKLDDVQKDKSKIIWTCDFQMRSQVYDEEERPLLNLFICSGPTFELDYDYSIEHSKKIFEAMFPGEDFLPRAPDPEEIIIGGEEEEEEEEDKEENVENSVPENQVESEQTEEAS